jgi:hypothetical protein
MLSSGCCQKTTVIRKYFMRNYKQGIFTPQNKHKYQGNHTNIVYRSGWERQVFVWLDTHPDVSAWSSEEFFIPYICKTDGNPHRYFVDVKIVFSSGITLLVEIKPESQIKKPVMAGKKINKRLVEEIVTYTKNTSKWKAAEDYCATRGWKFQIWGETALKRLGINVK